MSQNRDKSNCNKVRFLNKTSLKMLEATYDQAKTNMMRNICQSYSGTRGLCPIYEADEQNITRNDQPADIKSNYFGSDLEEGWCK